MCWCYNILCPCKCCFRLCCPSLFLLLLLFYFFSFLLLLLFFFLFLLRRRHHHYHFFFTMIKWSLSSSPSSSSFHSCQCVTRYKLQGMGVEVEGVRIKRKMWYFVHIFYCLLLLFLFLLSGRGWSYLWIFPKENWKHYRRNRSLAITNSAFFINKASTVGVKYEMFLPGQCFSPCRWYIVTGF